MAMNLKEIERDISADSFFPMALRYAAYTILIFAATSSLPAFLQNENIEAFKEGGWIECCQLLLLGGTSSLYFYEAFFSNHHQTIFHFLGCLSAFAAIRELDALLDRMIPLMGWKIGFVFILYALFSAYAHRKALLRQIRIFFKTHSIVMLWAGFIVAVPIGQLLGHGDFLQALMGDNYDRAYKRVIEETLELMGYILVFAGTVEAALELRAGSTDRPAAFERSKTYPRQHPKMTYWYK